MDIYVIPPVKNLELMNEGDRFFCLAQLYNKHQSYREFFQQKVKDGAWVTLDNGAGDHDPIPLGGLLKITENLHPSEVIPPDILFDGQQTIKYLELFLPELKAINRSSPKKPIEILGCPQGGSESDWKFVYKYMLTHPDVTTIGLSKIAVPAAFFGMLGDKAIKEARQYCYQLLKASDLIKKPIHLLGLGDPTELFIYRNDPLMRSNDSCNSVWSAMNGLDWTEQNFHRIPTPKDYFDRQMTPLNIDIAKGNIEWIKNLVNS